MSMSAELCRHQFHYHGLAGATVVARPYVDTPEILDPMTARPVSVPGSVVVTTVTGVLTAGVFDALLQDVAQAEQAAGATSAVTVFSDAVLAADANEILEAELRQVRKGLLMHPRISLLTGGGPWDGVVYSKVTRELGLRCLLREFITDERDSAFSWTCALAQALVWSWDMARKLYPPATRRARSRRS